MENQEQERVVVEDKEAIKARRAKNKQKVNDLYSLSLKYAQEYALIPTKNTEAQQALIEEFKAELVKEDGEFKLSPQVADSIANTLGLMGGKTRKAIKQMFREFTHLEILDEQAIAAKDPNVKLPWRVTNMMLDRFRLAAFNCGRISNGLGIALDKIIVGSKKASLGVRINSRKAGHAVLEALRGAKAGFLAACAAAKDKTLLAIAGRLQNRVTKRSDKIGDDTNVRVVHENAIITSLYEKQTLSKLQAAIKEAKDIIAGVDNMEEAPAEEMVKEKVAEPEEKVAEQTVEKKKFRTKAREFLLGPKIEKRVTVETVAAEDEKAENVEMEAKAEPAEQATVETEKKSEETRIREDPKLEARQKAEKAAQEEVAQKKAAAEARLKDLESLEYAISKKDLKGSALRFANMYLEGDERAKEYYWDFLKFDVSPDQMKKKEPTKAQQIRSAYKAAKALRDAEFIEKLNEENRRGLLKAEGLARGIKHAYRERVNAEDMAAGCKTKAGTRSKIHGTPEDNELYVAYRRNFKAISEIEKAEKQAKKEQQRAEREAKMIEKRNEEILEHSLKSDLEDFDKMVAANTLTRRENRADRKATKKANQEKDRRARDMERKLTDAGLPFSNKKAEAKNSKETIDPVVTDVQPANVEGTNESKPTAEKTEKKGWGTKFREFVLGPKIEKQPKDKNQEKTEEDETQKSTTKPTKEQINKAKVAAFDVEKKNREDINKKFNEIINIENDKIAKAKQVLRSSKDPEVRAEAKKAIKDAKKAKRQARRDRRIQLKQARKDRKQTIKNAKKGIFVDAPEKAKGTALREDPMLETEQRLAKERFENDVKNEEEWQAYAEAERQKTRDFLARLQEIDERKKAEKAATAETKKSQETRIRVDEALEAKQKAEKAEKAAEDAVATVLSAETEKEAQKALTLADVDAEKDAEEKEKVEVERGIRAWLGRRMANHRARKAKRQQAREAAGKTEVEYKAPQKLEELPFNMSTR